MQQDSLFLKKAKEIIKKNPEIFEALVEFEKFGKVPKFTHKERANFTIDSTILKKFREYCRKNNINMSAKIESLIIKELKTKL